MLKFMREQSSSWLIKTILWLVVAAFVGTIFISWGVGEYQSRTDVVAQVHNEKIYYEEYKDTLDNLYNLYRGAIKGTNQESLIPHSQLKRAALNTVIQRKLLINEARKMGIEVSNQEVIDQIRNFPSFQNNGRFDKNIYDNFLRYSRITARDFEKKQRTDLLLAKLQSLIKNSVKVSELELREAYSWKHEKINLDYLVIKPATFKEKVELTADKISEFYKKEREKFKKPDQLRVEYLFSDPPSYEKDVKMDEQDYVDYYNDHQDDYIEKEMVRASHILIKKSLTDLKEKADEQIKKEVERDIEIQKDEARKRAEKVMEELEKGGNFEELAKKYSEDEANANKGGDVGYFPRGRMMKEFEDAAFSLEISKFSDLVETIFGYHIIKVTDKKEGRIKPLKDVKEEINKKLVAKKSKKLAKRALLKILKSANPINEFKKYGDSGVVIKGTTEFFSIKDEIIPLVETSAQFKIEAFSLKENEASRTVETDKGFYLLRLLEKKESYIPQLDEVKDKVIESLSLVEQDKIANQEAHRLLNELKNGTSIDGLGEPAGIETLHTDFFDREQALNTFGMNKEFIKAVFQLKERESAVVPVFGKYYLVYMVERAGFDTEHYQKEKDEFLTNFIEDKQSKVLAGWLDNLRNNAEITINEQIL